MSNVYKPHGNMASFKDRNGATIKDEPEAESIG